MVRLTTAVALATFLLTTTVLGADKKETSRPVGIWERTPLADFVIKLTIEKEKWRCEVNAPGGESVIAQGNYSLAEDGTLFGIVTKVDKKGTDAGPEKGELFSIQFKADKDQLTISDYKASVDRPQVKELFEGKFKKK